ncbi:MAG TPA: methyltransferase domain-containing protein [Kaistia sp.]|nr:methyltransferase domain-containing protein [Kaistia sp.]
MTDEQKDTSPGGQAALAERQFGSQANAYVTSRVHAEGEDIAELAALAAAIPGARVLDLGCGGGHVSYAAAKVAPSVNAYDLSADMVAAVAREAAARGLAGIEAVQGPAERLPFADASFDVVLCRFTAHHWQDVRAGLREARRVLKPSGVAGFADVVAPELPVFDTFLQSFEMLRDPSHVRNYAVAEWIEIAGEAGFKATALTRRRLPLGFKSWIERMRTPQVFAEAIRALQSAVSDDVRRYFEIDSDGNFVIDTAVLTLKPL